MSKYHVYGIGNALVDREYEVSDEFLTKMNIEKGLMTLIDEDRKALLLNELNQIGLRDQACGGSAANTVMACNELGASTFYSCKVASDDLGDFYAKDLLSNGVKNNLGPSREDGNTGLCLVMITPDAQRTLNSYLGITANYSEQEIDFDALASSEYLYIEGYLAPSPTGQKAAVKAREFAQAQGVKTSLTFSDPGMVEFFGDSMSEMIGPGVDLIFANELEAKTFAKAQTIEDCLESMKKIAKEFVITRGENGALVWNGEKTIEVSAPKVKAIDTNGAGDLFAGSYLYGITHGHGHQKSAELACKAASKLVTCYGPRLKKEQLLEISKEILG